MFLTLRERILTPSPFLQAIPLDVRTQRHRVAMFGKLRYQQQYRVVFIYD
jgi:hypothetical protein